MKSLLIKDCTLVSPGVELEGVSVLVEGDRIRRIFACDEKLPRASRVIDAAGDFVMPGFIDTHCHGSGGFDFMDGTDKAIETMAVNKLAEGVTTLLPTTLTQSEKKIAAALASAARYQKSKVKGCHIPCVHLEGPFINPNCLGAQNPKFVRKPDIEEVRRMAAIFPVGKVSYAVEMEGGPRFAAELMAEGIVPSCVHSSATFAQFKEGVEHGLHSLSHFCNQMTPLHHREIGLVGAGLALEDVSLELICDCHHVCPDMIQLIFSIKNTDKIQLVTDAMRAAGLPDGESEIGGLQVIVKNGEARLKSNGALAGSTLKLNDALRNVYELTGYSLSDLVKTTSLNQAQMLGFEKIGRVQPGWIADLVILNGNLDVRSTIISGQVYYEAE